MIIFNLELTINNKTGVTITVTNRKVTGGVYDPDADLTILAYESTTFRVRNKVFDYVQYRYAYSSESIAYIQLYNKLSLIKAERSSEGSKFIVE